MTINMTKLYEVFNGWGCSEIIGIAENVLGRMDSTDTDELWDAMDDELIYTADQWEMLKYYCTPDRADLMEAYDAFYNDLCKAIAIGALEMDEDKDEETT